MSDDPNNNVTQILFDDTYTAIQYTGDGWFQDDGSSFNNIGNSGQVFNHTIHGTRQDGSFTLLFEGLKLTAFGSTNVTKVGNGTDPSWECFLEGDSLSSIIPPFNFDVGNNQYLCDTGALEVGPHKFEIRVNSSGNAFWLDYLLMIPLSTTAFDETVLVLDNDNPAIQYDQNWSVLSSGVEVSANFTQAAGAKATVNFIGTKVTWLGVIPEEYARGSASGSYTIDNGSSTHFPLNGLSDFQSTQTNVVFFETPDLQAGPHSLVVTYDGSGGSGLATPLTLDVLYVTNVSLSQAALSSIEAASSTQGASTTTGTASASSSPSSNHSGLIGGVVGGVVGGLLLLALSLAAILLRRKKQRMKRNQKYAAVPFTDPSQQQLPDDSPSAPPMSDKQRRLVAQGTPPPGYQDTRPGGAGHLGVLGSQPGQSQTQIDLSSPTAVSSSSGNGTIAVVSRKSRETQRRPQPQTPATVTTTTISSLPASAIPPLPPAYTKH